MQINGQYVAASTVFSRTPSPPATCEPYVPLPRSGARLPHSGAMAGAPTGALAGGEAAAVAGAGAGLIAIGILANLALIGGLVYIGYRAGKASCEKGGSSASEGYSVGEGFAQGDRVAYKDINLRHNPRYQGSVESAQGNWVVVRWPSGKTSREWAPNLVVIGSKSKGYSVREGHIKPGDRVVIKFVQKKPELRRDPKYQGVVHTVENTYAVVRWYGGKYRHEYLDNLVVVG